MSFSQSSPKFSELTGSIEITSRNMHVKLEAVWRNFNFRKKNADIAGSQKKDEILTFSQNYKIHETYRIYWNQYQKHACENGESLEKLQILTEKFRQHKDLRYRMKF